MQTQTLPQPAGLLADPEQVALVRDLIRHARKVRAEHAIYPGGRATSGATWPTEHTWTAGPGRVLVHDGWLIYLSHGHPLLKAQVDNVRQVGQLLAAIGVLPQRFIGPQIRTEDTGALTDEPGPEITEVHDIDGEVWQRDHNGGGWRYHGYGDATPWAEMAELFGPITVGGAR